MATINGMKTPEPQSRDVLFCGIKYSAVPNRQAASMNLQHSLQNAVNVAANHRRQQNPVKLRVVVAGEIEESIQDDESSTAE